MEMYVKQIEWASLDWAYLVQETDMAVNMWVSGAHLSFLSRAKRSLFFGFPHQTVYAFLFSPYKCCIPY
jgi:hypothetical protein